MSYVLLSRFKMSTFNPTKEIEESIMVHYNEVNYTCIPSCWSHYDINFLENLHEVMHIPSPETYKMKFRSYIHNNFQVQFYI